MSAYTHISMLWRKHSREARSATALIRCYGGKMERKRRKPGSLYLADAMNIVTANRYGTNILLATDQDYPPGPRRRRLNRRP